MTFNTGRNWQETLLTPEVLRIIIKMLGCWVCKILHFFSCFLEVLWFQIRKTCTVWSFQNIAVGGGAEILSCKGEEKSLWLSCHYFVVSADVLAHFWYLFLLLLSALGLPLLQTIYHQINATYISVEIWNCSHIFSHFRCFTLRSWFILPASSCISPL